MRAESLIFDIDGTLWDSRALVAEGYNIQLRREGYPQLCVTAEDLKALFGRTMTEIADILLASVAPEQRYGLMERCMETEHRILEADPCRIGYPGVRETLEQLKKKYRLFIVSNSQKGYPELVMEKLGIGHLFSGHLCFGDTGTDKGSTIVRLMKEHQITDAVYIGDTQGDCDAAEKAGIGFVWAAYGFGQPRRWDASVDSPAGLTALF